MKKQMNAFCSWSGGKDSAMALYRSLNSGVTVSYFLNTITEDGKYSRSHGIKSEIIRSQADALQTPVLQVPTTWDDYEENFRAAAKSLKAKGIDTGIFGDIDLEPHRQWVERVCAEVGITPLLPLWLESRQVLLNEFIEAGFQAVITATESSIMGDEWLGRTIDQTFIDDMASRPDIDLCGEKGEFHTLVTDGPIFKKKLTILGSEPAKINKHWFLNITGCQLIEKK